MATPRLRLRVTAKAESKLRGGHPWLFSDSITEQNRPGTPGELAIIFDRKDCFLAVGLFDPFSPIRVRILHSGKPQAIDSSWWEQHIQSALDRRHHLFGADTTGYRLINGESDGWPGLVLDRYADVLVIKLYTAAWLPRFSEIASLIRERHPVEQMVLRLSRNIQETARADFQLTDGQVVFGTALRNPVVFTESGIQFEADVLRGQKTGFFLDQRDNRRLVETMSPGRTVLNAFSFSGGFSLYAARGGAKSVTDLDISAHALASAERNFSLNPSDAKIARCPHRGIQADTFEWLEQAQDRFDLIVLDPPSLAKREQERAGAIQAYNRLSRLGIERLRPGGILVSASCSAHVSAEEFFGAVRLAARQSRRPHTEKLTTRHPPDHPATFPEAEYLKCIYMEFR